MSDNYWTADLFDLPPLSALAPSNNYLLNLGSGIYPSMATTSQYGTEYFAGIDIFRTDFDSRNQKEPLINIDHYIISPVGSTSPYGIYKIPNIGYHWPKLQDPIIQSLPLSWKHSIEGLLKQKR